ncbi:MAG: RNA-directed DNA polymerase, partial [bacterium]
ANKKGERLAKAHIQRLFSLYPRRAIRKILQEESKGYSGDRESAEAFLKRTYERPQLSTEQTAAARKLYDECHWSEPNEETLGLLSSPPKREEISAKLARATNTAPGKDGLEYRHLRALDPSGRLLEKIFELVWKYGIPKAWKTARTVPIYKKGDPSDYGNFRPISLLPTIYKLFSGIINSRLLDVASSMGWISPEQKGFLPGVRGIQEHTHLLQTLRDVAVRLKLDLIITFLDLLNAFGSIPHAILEELFESLPIPPVLRRILVDIYEGNTLEFAAGPAIISIDPTAGVRQGDPLSTGVFDLAIEPVLRAAKSSTNLGFSVFGFLAKVTGYADDLAVIGMSVADQQRVLDVVDKVASILQLQFNPGKCVSLVLEKGRVPNLEPDLRIHGATIRALKEEENEEYLGTPMGSKLLFRMPDELKGKLDKLADSGLSPWQKLEVFRCALLPSLSHHLASGKVEKGSLHELEQDCKDFLRYVANVPLSANSAFFYADRRVGGLGAQSLSQEADIWTIARAVQLLDSKDKTIKDIASAQLQQTILDGFGSRRQPVVIPYGEYLSGSMEKGLTAIAHGGKRSNLWTRARAAAIHLKGVKIDISGENPTRIIADDVSCISAKVVRGLRTAIRERWTNHLLQAPQGKIATGLALDTKTKDIAFLTSCRTTLSFGDWHNLHRARLGLLPVRSCPGSKIPDKTCRRGCREAETTAHVISHCKNNLSLYTDRHNQVLDSLAETIRKSGHHVTVNHAFDHTILRPDLVINSTTPETIIDVTVPLDTAENLNSAHRKKVEKYNNLGEVLPLVVGSLGAWLPSNDAIRDTLNIPPRLWNGFRRRSRFLAIQGTTRIIQRHLHNGPTDSSEDEVDDRSQ